MTAASRGWMVAALGLTLVVGASMGVAVDRFVLTSPERHAASSTTAETRPEAGDESASSGNDGRHREPLLDRLTRELELTGDQQIALEGVLSTNRERARQYWQESRGEYGALREEFRASIRAVLSDPQRAQFDEMLSRDQPRRDERRRRPSDQRR